MKPQIKIMQLRRQINLINFPYTCSSPSKQRVESIIKDRYFAEYLEEN